MDEQEIIDGKALEKILHISHQTLRRWKKRGILCPIDLPGRFRYTRATIEKFMENCNKKPKENDKQ